MDRRTISKIGPQNGNNNNKKKTQNFGAKQFCDTLELKYIVTHMKLI